MLYPVFSALSLAGSAVECSAPISMGDFNAAQLDMGIAYIASASAPTVKLQISNDGENWYDKATISWNATASAVGHYNQTAPTTALGMAYIRMQVTAGAALILSMGVNLSRQ